MEWDHFEFMFPIPGKTVFILTQGHDEFTVELTQRNVCKNTVCYAVRAPGRHTAWNPQLYLSNLHKCTKDHPASEENTYRTPNPTHHHPSK